MLIAYGISQETDARHSDEFLIGRHDAAYRLAGLSFPTKFDFRKCVDFPYHRTWFEVPSGAPSDQAWKLGLLHPNLVQCASAAWDAVAAAMTARLAIDGSWCPSRHRPRWREYDQYNAERMAAGARRPP